MRETRIIRVMRSRWDKIVRSVLIEFEIGKDKFVVWFPFDGRFDRLSDDPYFHKGDAGVSKNCIMPEGADLAKLESAAKRELRAVKPAPEMRRIPQ